LDLYFSDFSRISYAHLNVGQTLENHVDGIKTPENHGGHLLNPKLNFDR
jgi:hypothetical protein